MIKNIKKSGFILLLTFIMIFSVACNDEQNNEEKNVTVKLGLVSDKHEEDDNLIIKLNPDGEEDVDLKIEDKASYDEIELDKYYMVTYNKENEVIFIEKSGFINDIMKTKDALDKKDEKEKRSQIDDVKLSEAIDLENFNLIDSFELINAESEDKNIVFSMYTDAEKDENGIFMWDDGQNWKLIGHTENGDYILYDDYLQIGNLKFFVYTEDENLKIGIFETGSAGLRFINYEFNEDKNIFEGKIEFLADDNVNLLYSSIINSK